MAKCKFCKSKFEPKFFLDKACQNDECRTMFVKQTISKANKQREKEQKKQRVEKTKQQRIEKNNIKTLGDWKNMLQPFINQIARLIDYGQPCIVTGSYKGKMNGGHCIAVGSNATLRYNLHNIHIQSEYSNKHKGGDNIRYKEGIERVYGKQYLEFINELQQTETINLSIVDIQNVMPEVKQIIKELKDSELIYSPDERIMLRNKYNERIGIYKIMFNENN